MRAKSDQHPPARARRRKLMVIEADDMPMPPIPVPPPRPGARRVEVRQTMAEVVAGTGIGQSGDHETNADQPTTWARMSAAKRRGLEPHEGPRAAGFYWVRRGWTWAVAEWTGYPLGWRAPGTSEDISDAEWDEIDERRIIREDTGDDR